MDFKHLTKTIHRAIFLLTLLSTGLLLMSFLFTFDAVNGYFINGILPTLFKIVFVLGIIFSLVSAFAFCKQEIIKTDNNATAYKIIFIIIAAALALSSLVFNIFTVNKHFTSEMAGICFFAIFVMLCAAKDGYKYSHTKLACLLLSALFPLAMTIDNNSVMHRHSNSVENTLSSVFAIAFLLYILYEGNRIFTGQHSRWHFSSMLLASHTGFTLSISYIAAYITGNVNEKTRLYQMILIFILSVFTELELIRFTKAAESRSPQEWDEIESSVDEAIEQ